MSVNAWQLGYRDGAELARESGSTEPGPVGWDGLLLVAIGFRATCRLFGQDPVESRDGWSEAMRVELQDYCEGAQAGAESQVV